MDPERPSGLHAVPRLPWGTHATHFFSAGSELRDLLVPYFKAGLQNNERCLWVTGPAFDATAARAALRGAVPDLDTREREGQIEIADAHTWYAANAKLEPETLVCGLLQREQDALSQGYAGLRTHGNCAWVSSDQWEDFLQYERLVNEAVTGRRLICLCSYCHEQLGRGADSLAVMSRHDIVLTTPSRRRSSPSRWVSDPDPMANLAAPAFERQQHRFDQAMAASKMGTWRYTLADNMCVYDENAQRLYGLTEARLLHDEEGAKARFHPDDLQLMWRRVAKALDPAGDGQYEVEYRVKQLDGGWRWVSAWGLVEFQGTGPHRRPVAIDGASKDLTERKEAEELQQLLINELQHRINNTLASIRAGITRTLRSAPDLESARVALDHQIVAMARANNPMTLRTWTRATLHEIVTQVLDPFPWARIQIVGEQIEVPEKHHFALSLILHELATNAVKYGAFSCDEGRVLLSWAAAADKLTLEWKEQNGPAFRTPTRHGFGDRLIHALARSLGGEIRPLYDPSGFVCNLVISV